MPLVESTRANKLDVYEYLKYLLTEMSNNHHQEDPTVIDGFCPGQKTARTVPLKNGTKNASNNDVAIITEKLLCRTTLCFEALTFNLISEDLERNLLACIDVSHFDQPISMHHNELFPFAVNINIPDTNLCMFHPSLEIHTISQQAKSYSLYKSALLQNKQTHQSYFWLLVHLK